MAILIAVIGFVGLFGLLIVYNALTSAVVLSFMWGWFITPVFNTPVPPAPLIMGISLLAHYLTSRLTPIFKDLKRDSNSEIATGLVNPWFVLLMAWLVHLWAGYSLGVWG